MGERAAHIYTMRINSRTKMNSTVKMESVLTCSDWSRGRETGYLVAEQGPTRPEQDPSSLQPTDRLAAQNWHHRQVQMEVPRLVLQKERLVTLCGQPTTGSSSWPPDREPLPPLCGPSNRVPHTTHRIVLESLEEEVQSNGGGSPDDAELVPRWVHVKGAAWPQCSYSTHKSLPQHCPEVYTPSTPWPDRFFLFLSNSFSQSYHKRKRYTICSHPVNLLAGRVSTQGDTHEVT